MASKVEIANKALLAIGTKTRLRSLEDGSREARALLAAWDIARKAALRIHDWNFATAHKILAERPEAYRRPDYQRAYEYPNDCVAARYILPAVAGSNPPPFEVGVSPDRTQKVIFCDISPVTLIYTCDITNEELFDAGFVDSFALKLGADCVKAITGSDSGVQRLTTLFENSAPRAQAQDANEGKIEDTFEATWIEARIPGIKSWDR